MAENIVVNGVTYNGVDSIAMQNTEGQAVGFYPDAVRYSAQALTEAQKAKARENIGAIQEAVMGTTDQVTPTQILSAILDSRNVVVSYNHSVYGLIYFTNFGLADSMNILFSSAIVEIDGTVLYMTLFGHLENDAWFCEVNALAKAEDIPTEVTAQLTAAKESGAFKGDKGDPGGDYVMTDADKADLLAEVRATANQQTPLFANSVAECTDTGKVYVLPDGNIYGYIMTAPEPPAITIEAKTGGYWGYDDNNDKFFWTTASGWNAKLSNQIPVTPGDQLSYKGKMQYSGNRSYVWYNSKMVEITSATISSESSPTVLTAPANAAYFQCASFSNTGTAVLEVAWVLCQAAAPTYAWASTGHAFVPADYENRILALESSVGETVSVLKGKKIVYDGDSICESRTSYAANGGGYARLIAERVGGTYENQAVGGARLTAANGASYHSVVDNLTNLPTDGDLYCFEGGINDYWTPKALGTFSKTDFTGTLDTNTICGALETIFRYALTNFVGKPVCFVIVHKIQSTAYAKNANGDTFEDYRNAMIGICNKYSIPYYDAFHESGLNGWNTAQSNTYLTANTDGTGDGIHPNEEGYKRYYVPQLISLFEKIMPVTEF